MSGKNYHNKHEPEGKHEEAGKPPTSKQEPQRLSISRQEPRIVELRRLIAKQSARLKRIDKQSSGLRTEALRWRNPNGSPKDAKKLENVLRKLRKLRGQREAASRELDRLERELEQSGLQEPSRPTSKNTPEHRSPEEGSEQEKTSSVLEGISQENLPKANKVEAETEPKTRKKQKKSSETKRARYEKELAQVKHELKQQRSKGKSRKVRKRVETLRRRKAFLEYKLHGGVPRTSRYKTWTYWSKGPGKVRFYRGRPG